jgi:ankyrin repeat protein
MSFPDMSVVKLLARKMGNEAVNDARDSYGNSMLNKAVVDSNLPIAEFFMGIPGVDLNQFNFKGLTPICEAANNRRMDIAELLLKNGVNINTPVNPESRYTLLHNAVMTSNDGLARWAMERKIDHNARDSRGQTALDVAVATKNIPMIELLVDSDNTDINSGCYKAVTAQDRTASTQYRRPPLQLAVVQMLESPKLPAMNQMTDVVALLIDLGANVNAQDSNGTTALHLLAQELDRIKAQFGARAERAPNVRRILKMMVKAGVDPNIADFSGKRPVDVARQGASELKLLFDSGDFEILPPEQHAQGESNIAGRPMPDAPPLDSPLPTQSQVRARNTRIRFDDSQVPPGDRAGQ